MTIRVTMIDRILTWEFTGHSAIDKMVSALKDNLPGWVQIEIIVRNDD